jgi:MarR family transcriptional regulator, organic hydroperoxide resistance regulator
MPSNDRLIFLISTAQHLLKNHMIARFKEKGLEITPTHSTILFLLEERGPMQMNDISAEIHVENSTVTGLVDRLESRGFVVRTTVKRDRRKWHIAITDRGSAEIQKAREILHAINAEIGEGLSAKELEAFKKALNSFFSKFAGPS